MKWLETIRVQAAGDGEGRAQGEFSCLLQDIRNHRHDEGLLDLTYYVHALIPGYIAIHLFWDTESPQVLGSQTGLSLTQLLKSFGLVDHSVWICESPHSPIGYSWTKGVIE